MGWMEPGGACQPSPSGGACQTRGRPRQLQSVGRSAARPTTSKRPRRGQEPPGSAPAASSARTQRTREEHPSAQKSYPISRRPSRQLGTEARAAAQSVPPACRGCGKPTARGLGRQVTGLGCPPVGAVVSSAGPGPWYRVRGHATQIGRPARLPQGEVPSRLPATVIGAKTCVSISRCRPLARTHTNGGSCERQEQVPVQTCSGCLAGACLSSRPNCAAPDVQQPVPPLVQQFTLYTRRTRCHEMQPRQNDASPDPTHASPETCAAQNLLRAPCAILSVARPLCLPRNPGSTDKSRPGIPAAEPPPTLPVESGAGVVW